MNPSTIALLALPLIALSAQAADLTFPIERPTLAVGDTFTMQYRDLANDTIRGKHTLTVTGVNESGYAITVDGALGNRTPIEALSRDLGWEGKVNGQPSDGKWLDFPLTAGKAWSAEPLWISGAFSGIQKYDFAVVGIEDVAVPAGTFKAVKVHGKGFWNVTGWSGAGRPIGGGSIETDVWYAPAAKAIVKFETTSPASVDVKHYAYELTAFKVQ